MEEANGPLDELVKIRPRTVVFKDNTPDVRSGNKRKQSVTELPNAKFIEIHAAMAQVLHPSGAGEFFDALSAKVGEYRGSAESSPSWGEMEEKLEVQSLKSALEEVLG